MLSRTCFSPFTHLFCPPPPKSDRFPKFSNSGPSEEESGPQDEGGDDVGSSSEWERRRPEQLRQVSRVTQCCWEP